MVAFSANKLVWPAMALMSPITSPMRSAASPSCDMVFAVRLDSATARAATSLDFMACEAISSIDTASSSIELATVATLVDAAPTLCSASCACDETESAALFSPCDAPPSRSPDDRNRASTCSTDARNCPIIVATASTRRSRVALACISTAASRPRSIMLSRNTITVRAMAPISSPALIDGMAADVSPSASCFIAERKPASGVVMLRPMSQLNTKLIKTAKDAISRMRCRICVREAVSMVTALLALNSAVSMMRSASGSTRSVSAPILRTSGSMASVLAAQRVKARS